MKSVMILSIACTAALLTGCQTEPVVTGNPMIRTLSAAVDNSPLDICVNGQLSIEDFDTGGRTGHGAADTQRFEMATAPTGTSCDQATPVTGLENINLTPEQFSTVVVLPDGVSAIQLTDDNTPLPTGQAKFRVINMSEDSGTVTVTDQNDDDATKDAAFNNASDFEYVPLAAGTYNFIVTTPADDEQGRLLEGVELEEGKTYTIFVTGRVDGVGAAWRASLFEDLSVGVEETAS